MAAKKTQQLVEYGKDEITPSEAQTMRTAQFKDLTKQKSREQETLKRLKTNFLTDGLSQKARSKVDISSIINQESPSPKVSTS